MAYVELRAHTGFSFGTAAVSPERLVERAAALGYTALGLTDAADLGGVVRFALACRRAGVTPLVGLELAVTPDPQSSDADDPMPRPVALLARTMAGYRALGALVTRARAGNLAAWAGEDAGRAAGAPARGRPAVPWRAVAEAAGGGRDLVLLTGPTVGPLAARVRRGDRAGAARLLGAYREAFGDALAVEVQLHHAGRREEALAGALAALAEREGARWAVAGDVRYVDAAGRRAFDVLLALRHGTTLDAAAERGLLLPNDEWTLHGPEVVAERWRGRAAGIEATAVVADLCRFELPWARPPLPRFPVPDGVPPDAFLERCVMAGARERWGDRLSDAQRRQLAHELDVIRRLGFAGFFLVMWDAVREAGRRGILCQGRGSAANSAVAYVLGITAVDPVAHGLLFERFLSEARADGLTEAPDIDVDVEHDRREQLLDYVYASYGRAHAAIACVVQTYSASTAVQDVCRAYGVPVAVAHALSKRLHYVDPADGAEALRGGLAAAHGLDVTTPRGDALVQAVAAFEGLPRLRSTHPGGFVLSAEPLAECAPVEPTTMGRTILQYDKDDLDALGVPKFDFLGLGALGVVRRAFDAVALRTGERPAMYRLPPDDPATFATVAAGDTVGMFQVESRAQISSLVHTRPERLYDLVVQVALIRPGPIVAKFVHPYTRRRRGLERVEYPPGMEALLAPILGRTQGIPIFQEQAMALAMHVAGYTAVEADELRRTMGHQRKAARLALAIDALKERMAARGVDAAVAEQLADDLRVFANYGFPESHAWSFALIAYATAWLKAHHPAAFYAALLDAQPMGFYSVATLVHDARRRGVEVRPPCLSFGEATCTLEERDDAPDAPALRVGWRQVRGLGDGALARLTAARARAPFRSVADAVRRAALGRDEAAALARAHAFAVWVPERRRAVWEALRVAGDVLPLAPAPAPNDDAAADPADGHAADGYAPAPEDPHVAVLADYHAVGLSVAGHPMGRYRAWCRRVGALSSADLARCRGGERVVTAGLVITRQRPTTAKGTTFLLLEDEHGTGNVIVPPKIDARDREATRHGAFVLVLGRAERDGPLVNVIARRVEAFGPEVLRGASVTRTGHGPMATLGPEPPLAHRSHDFR
jgi:error-prone DNA polymerase